MNYLGTLRIAVACPSEITNKEWGYEYEAVYRDYALMKVLYMLREGRTSSQERRVHAFKWEDPLIPLDFSDLRDSDMILIVGHGDPGGLYALGPNKNTNTERLVEILTKDGNLKKKRKGKRIIIPLLSCRAGLGLHKVLAHELYNKLGRDVIVGGAKGFTFGSMRTRSDHQNEVLIEGLPWFMEYPKVYNDDPKKAEKKTQEIEKNKKITYDRKKKEIEKFKADSMEHTKGMQDIISKLKSKEVNNALDEIQDKFQGDWEAWIMLQRNLYEDARKRSNLDFDMWYPNLTKSYVWTNGKKMTDQEVDSFLKGVKGPSGAGATSIK